ncbi:hypothetical protein JCM18920_2719 [Cutibacterium acnes JCM 18920]|nr:hypothetical protein JCM18920_2719 [Cutibacterium acnes JCM 18920]
MVKVLRSDLAVWAQRWFDGPHEQVIVECCAAHRRRRRADRRVRGVERLIDVFVAPAAALVLVLVIVIVCLRGSWLVDVLVIVVSAIGFDFFLTYPTGA